MSAANPILLTRYRQSFPSFECPEEFGIPFSSITLLAPRTIPGLPHCELVGQKRKQILPPPPSVQTGVQEGHAFHIRSTPKGWCYTLIRRHGTTFGGPFASYSQALTRAERVMTRLLELRLAM